MYIRINGRRYPAKEGQTILQVAKANVSRSPRSATTKEWRPGWLSCAW